MQVRLPPLLADPDPALLLLPVAAGGANQTAGAGAAGGSTTPNPTSTPTPASPVVVRVRAGVRGYTRLTFNSNVFRAALATTLAVALSRVTIADVSDARRASDLAVTVTSDVGYPSGTDTAAVLATAENSADLLTANLRAGGMSNASVTAIIPSVYKSEAGAAPPPPPSPQVVTTAAAVAAGVLGFGLLATVAVIANRTLTPPPPKAAPLPPPKTTPAASAPPPLAASAALAAAASTPLAAPPAPVSPSDSAVAAGIPVQDRASLGLVYMPVPLEQQPMWVGQLTQAQTCKPCSGDMVTADLVLLGRC